MKDFIFEIRSSSFLNIDFSLFLWYTVRVIRITIGAGIRYAGLRYATTTRIFARERVLKRKTNY